MIKLKNALNHKGGLLPAGTVIGLGEMEETLITNGAAEKYDPIAPATIIAPTLGPSVETEDDTKGAGDELSPLKSDDGIMAESQRKHTSEDEESTVNPVTSRKPRKSTGKLRK